ncbi:MAG: transposase [Deltaproteobacteria bacterium]|nr:transposase [Deltaproteobacteria bacterium]
MPIEMNDGNGSRAEDEIPALEDIELTHEDLKEIDAESLRFAESVAKGHGADPAMKSVNETLMPGGAVLVNEERIPLCAELPESFGGGEIVKTLHEQRVRYDFSVSVTRIALDLEKKVVVDDAGERHVITPSTLEYGPPRFSVTWDALATLTVLVGQFAMPFNRLGRLFSTQEKRFSAGTLSRMFRYVAHRWVPIYLELGNQLANSEILSGDDTSCRVIEVSRFSKLEKKPDEPPWADYRTPKAAKESLRRCEKARKDRMRRRDEGDRSAIRTSEETPSLGVLIGRELTFESPLKNTDGPKEAIHTTVISGRSDANVPNSLIVFYRSHIGSFGNLLAAILKKREPHRKALIVQGDLSTSNLVTSSEILEHFDVRTIGCSAHARRPFAIYEDEDPDRCAYMLHLFLGLAIHEHELDIQGRNRENVLAVRNTDSRELWNDILELAKNIANRWSKGTKLGNGARYIINHFDALTAYLDDPRLEPSNNLRERMLRMEKMIEDSSMFRRSLEGRFALDIVRTILQTAVAAGVPIHEYLVSVLRTDDDDIRAHPDRFTPRAWAEANLDVEPSPSSP